MIAGGGLAALMAAHFLRLYGETGEILVVERAAEVGGLLRAHDGGQWGKFDQGMHTFTSTLIPELDEIVFGMLPTQEWVWLKDATRDISGVAFQGMLQKKCHYVDLRLLGEELRRRCVLDLFENLDRPQPPAAPKDMQDYAERRFGRVIATEVISPILEKLYGRKAAEIDPVVAKLLPFDRVALFSEPTFRRMLESPLIRERIAYPEQRKLPLRFASGHYSVYPKAFGAYRLVDAIVARLRAEKVQILTGTDIADLAHRQGRISRLVLRSADGVREILDPKDVYWTAGVQVLARSLGLGSAALCFEAPKTAAIMNILIDHPPRMDDLYYFWGFDTGTQCFRVTNFSAYSPGAPRSGGYPLSVEFYLHEDQPKDEASLLDLTLREMRAYGVIGAETRVLHHAGHAGGAGFPILSLRNRAVLEAARGEIAGLGIGNLAITGIQSEWGVVYQPDVLAHAWKTVRGRLDAGARDRPTANSGLQAKS